MSKRCKLQKEYYKEFGNYKGSGKYTDHYVNWLESKVLAINYTHCCTELKTLKQGEKLILDNKFDVEVVAPSEKNVLIKYKETDRIVWVNEQRLKQK